MHEQLKHVIAFAGLSGSGKTTAASFLSTSDRRYVPYSFADPIKQTCTQYFDTLLADLDNQETKAKLLPGLEETGRTYRDFMRFLGMGARKEFSPDFWVNLLSRTLDNCRVSHIVIDDLRFKNELEWLLSLQKKGTQVDVFKIQQKDMPEKYRVVKGKGMTHHYPNPRYEEYKLTHESEMQDFGSLESSIGLYCNDGTLEDLEAWTQHLHDTLLLPK